MEKKSSGSCVSELVEYWSLAIAHSSIQGGREGLGTEALISKIYKIFHRYISKAQVPRSL